MSWVKVESSVRTNRKFLQAGPAASWLWLCGLAYCQDTLTDGFIPSEALQYLGVERPHKLITKLVDARLWDEEDGGWRIHDYLKHNKPAEEINRIKRARASGGNLGGRPTENLKGKPSEAEKVNHTGNPSTATAVATEAATATPTIAEGEFQRFQMAYPSTRRKGGYQAETLFFDARQKVGLGDMLDALDNHKASEQWQTPRLIPGMDTWLKEERWNQRLDPPKQAWRPEEAAS